MNEVEVHTTGVTVTIITAPKEEAKMISFWRVMWIIVLSTMLILILPFMLPFFPIILILWALCVFVRSTGNSHECTNRDCCRHHRD